MGLSGGFAYDELHNNGYDINCIKGTGTGNRELIGELGDYTFSSEPGIVSGILMANLASAFG